MNKDQNEQNVEALQIQTLYQKTSRVSDKVLRLLIYLCAGLTLGVLIAILVYIFGNGIGYLSWEFLFSPYSPVASSPDKGILPMIINTLYVVVITLIIVVPVGICSAVYMTQYAKQGAVIKLIRFATDTLAGIPSILFGLFGYTVFCVMFGMRTSILAGCLTMVICVLPTIVRTTEEALLAVPKGYKEGAMALGAGKFRVIAGIVIPCAVPGILTAVILAMGRIIGESAALLFTVGTGTNMADNAVGHLFESGRTLTLHLYYMATTSTEANAMQVCFATATVLLILVLLLNLIAKLTARHLKKG